MLQEKVFSKLAEHQAEHQKLSQQVSELRDQLRSGKLVLTTGVMRFLKNWLADHIMRHDQTYAQELKIVVPEA